MLTGFWTTRPSRLAHTRKLVAVTVCLVRQKSSACCRKISATCCMKFSWFKFMSNETGIIMHLVRCCYRQFLVPQSNSCPPACALYLQHACYVYTSRVLCSLQGLSHNISISIIWSWSKLFISYYYRMVLWTWKLETWTMFEKEQIYCVVVDWNKNCVISSSLKYLGIKCTH